jgi:UDP-N-acetylmuramate--alanine ligase
VNAFGSNAKLGKGEYMVVEADESDGSFRHLPPTIAVVTNIDPEHLDYWKTPAALRQGFLDFVNRVPFYGLAILYGDHPTVQSLIPELEKRFVTYGEGPQSEYRADRIEVRQHRVAFDAFRRDAPLGRFEVGMVGRHNALNALSVVALGDEMGIPTETTRAALRSFEGVQRRFTVRGEAGGVTVVDDYGHNPTELRAALETARALRPRRLVALYVPHVVERTRQLHRELGEALGLADVAIVTDFVGQRDAAREGVGARLVLDAVPDPTRRLWAPTLDDGAGLALHVVRPGDLVVTLGVGEPWRAAQAILAGLPDHPGEA